MNFTFSFLVLQFVVGLGDKVSPMDIEEGMHVGYRLYSSLGFVKSAGRWSPPLLCWFLLISVVSYHSAKWFVFGRVDCNKYQIQIPLPPKIDSSVTMMTVEEKPDVTHNDIWGGGVFQITD